MKTLGRNKKAHFEYVLTPYEDAGIVLEGWEVKSIIKNGIKMDSAFVLIRDEEAFLVGALINKNGETAISKQDQSRTRKLLLTKKQLRYLVGCVTIKGMTIIPTECIYSDSNKIKIKIAVAKGKNLRDKRETIKERDLNRNISREFSGKE